MFRTVYVSGDFIDERDARVSIFDRAFLFGDGVYEVTAVIDGAMVDNDAHLARLKRSLESLGIVMPCTERELVSIQNELIRRNGLDEGAVYLQITRGSADRDFRFPTDPAPTLVMFTQARSLVDNPAARRGISVVIVPDLRWKRRDIKTVGLLAASMARQQAVQAGADDAWMVEDGLVTEGTSNNAYIVTAEGRIVTRHLGIEILHGITRAAVLALSRRDGIEIEERPFSVDEARAAREAFITSSTAFVCPVVRIDELPVGDGRPGPVTRRLRNLYIEMARSSAVRRQDSQGGARG